MADFKLAESLFASIDTIVDKRIANLPYDKTILATIENTDESDKGRYIINDGSTTMEAFSDNTSLSVGERVYVNVPLGDYNQQLNIIGRYIPDGTNTVPIGYVDPMTTFVDITGNLFENEQGEFHLIANGDQLETETIWAWAADNINTFPLMGYDIIGLSGDFFSNVGKNQTILSGEYGLRLDIIAEKKSTQVYNSDNRVYYSLKLSSDNFFGDPYNFETFYKQAEIMDLIDKDIDRIDAMRLVFYQNGNFRDENFELISADIADYNLAVNNIVLKLGYSLEKYKSDTVLLYTFDPKTYVNQVTDSMKQKYSKENIEQMNSKEIETFIKKVNHKILQCRWIHFTENGSVVCYGQEGSELPETANIKWYRYKLKEQTDEQYTYPPGDFWDEMPDYENKFVAEFDPDFTEYHEAFKVVLKNPSDSYIEEQIENDNNHLEASRYEQACLNFNNNFDPLVLFKLYFENKKYKAWLIKKAFKEYETTFLTQQLIDLNNQMLQEVLALQTDAERNQKISEIKEEYSGKEKSLISLLSQIYLQEDDKIDQGLKIYNDLLASRREEDKAAAISLIKYQVEFFKNWLNNFKFYYIEFKDTSDLDIEAKIKSNFNVTKDLFEKNYLQFSYFNLIEDSDYSTRFKALFDTYVSNKENLQVIAHNINITGYNKINNQLTLILNEINKAAQERDYSFIRTEFDKIEDVVLEQASSYYTTWLGTDENGDLYNDPSHANFNELNYVQVFNYSYYDSLYKTWKSKKENIETTFKASGNYYLSEDLEFLNEDPEVALVKLQTIKNLKLEVDIDNYNGVYRFYNDDGSIINKAEASHTRKLTAKYTTLLTGDSRIDTAEKITWKIPKQSTMIEPPVEGKEYNLYDEAEPTEAAFPFAEYYYYGYSGNQLGSGKPKSYILATTYNANEQYYVRNTTEVSEDDEFYYITKMAPLRDTVKYGTEEASSTEFLFRVKDFYVPTAKNNTIYCEVMKNNKVLQTETTLTFGIKGVIGTDYTFILQYEGNVDAVIYRGDPVKVIAKVFDYEGKDCSDRIKDFAFSWYCQNDNANGGLVLTAQAGQGYATITPQNQPIENYAHYILKARATNKVNLRAQPEETDPDQEAALNENSKQNFEVELVSYLPITIKVNNINHREDLVPDDNNTVDTYFQNSNILRYDGNYSITYDTTGTNPSYYKDPFKLWYWDYINKCSREFGNLQWGIIYGPDCYGSNNTLDTKYFPIMNNINALTVPSMYVERNGKQLTVYAKLNNSIIFLMPLYISTRVYNSAMLNSWNGGLTLNKENGTIMSAMIGAGYKNAQNQFFGVLMGRMTSVNESDLTNDYYSGTGLYGYNAGEKSFGLNINGKAFFGKSGKGQILIDGESGTIESASFKNYNKIGLSKPVGMKIDLDDGTIDIRGKIVGSNQSAVYISPGDQTGRDYFHIKSSSGKYLFRVSPEQSNGSDTYYLQSNDYDKVAETGLKFDLAKGSLDAYNFNMKATQSTGEYAGSYIQINSNGDPYFNVFYKDTSLTRGHSLMVIKPDTFTLSSPSWVGGNVEQGMQIDLVNGSIKNYGEFTLKAIATSTATSTSKGYKDSYVLLSSDPNTSYFRIHSTIWSLQDGQQHKDYDQDLLRITPTIFKLQSVNYSESIEKGNAEDPKLDESGNQKYVVKGAGAILNFSDANASIKFYNRKVYYQQNKKSTGYMYIDGTAQNYPINVYGRFRVHWDGTVECDNIDASVGGKIGPFHFDKNGLWYTRSGSPQYTSSSDAKDKTNTVYIGQDGLYLGTSFSVTYGGTLTASNATFNNMTANGGKIDQATITNGSISNATISNLVLGGETVNKSTLEFVDSITSTGSVSVPLSSAFQYPNMSQTMTTLTCSKKSGASLSHSYRTGTVSGTTGYGTFTVYKGSEVVGTVSVGGLEWSDSYLDSQYSVGTDASYTYNSFSTTFGSGHTSIPLSITYTKKSATVLGTSPATATGGTINIASDS